MPKLMIAVVACPSFADTPVGGIEAKAEQRAAEARTINNNPCGDA